jgi:hypothetical protein
MEAVTAMRKIVDKRCFISGMSGIVTDIKDICLREIPIYVLIAAILSFLVLELSTKSLLLRGNLRYRSLLAGRHHRFHLYPAFQRSTDQYVSCYFGIAGNASTV